MHDINQMALISVSFCGNLWHCNFTICRSIHFFSQSLVLSIKELMILHGRWLVYSNGA